MTWAETDSDNVKFNGRRSKHNSCFRLTSNDLLAASLSEGKAGCLRATSEKRGASWLSISNKPPLKIFLQEAANV
jgi:hypothetical protein